MLTAIIRIARLLIHQQVTRFDSRFGMVISECRWLKADTASQSLCFNEFVICAALV